MVVASGYVEANGLDNVERVVSELKTRGVEVNEINAEKVVFLIERENLVDVKAVLESLKKIEGVRNVYLAYYSLEGSDEGPDFEGNEMGTA
jgi:nitrate reductase NapAB chaperone NapD